MHRFSLLAVCLLAGGLAAQTTWYPPDSDNLTPWFNQAAPGDIIQLGFDHPPFVLNKGLTLLGPSMIIDWGAGNPGLFGSTVTVPPGARASMVDLHFHPSYDPNTGEHGGDLTINGDVSLDSCTWQSIGPRCVVSLRGTTYMQHCEASPHGSGFSGSPGLEVGVGATCIASDSTFHGCDVSVSAYYTFSDAKPGTQVAGTLIASDCVIDGGAGPYVSTSYPAAPALVCTGGSVYLTDSSLTGGSGAATPPTAGAAAMTGCTDIYAARTAFTGGAGTPPGPPSTGITNVPEMVGLTRIGAPTLGSSFTARATAGTSLGLLAMLGSFEADNVIFAPLVEPLLINPAQAFVVSVALPAAGATVNETVQVPNTPALAGAPVWLQALQFAGNAIHTSTVVGGTIR